MAKPYQFILFALIIIIIGVVAYSFRKQTFAFDSSKRYAVTLSNERTYYGKLISANENYIVLDEAYNAITTNTNDKKGLTLIKLGEGSYTSDGKIYINKDNVLIFSPIDDNSKINEAINRYEQGSTSSPVPSSSPTTQP